MSYLIGKLQADEPCSFLRVGLAEAALWAGWPYPLRRPTGVTRLEPVIRQQLDRLWERQDPQVLWAWPLEGPDEQETQLTRLRWQRLPGRAEYPVLNYDAPDGEFFHDGGLRLLQAAKQYPVALIASPFCGRQHLEDRRFAEFADCLVEIPAAYPEASYPAAIESLRSFLADKPRAVVLLSCPAQLEVEILLELLPEFGDRVWFLSIGRLLDAVQGVLGNRYNPFYRQRQNHYSKQSPAKLQPLVDSGYLRFRPHALLPWRLLKDPTFWTGIDWHLERVRSGKHFTIMRIGEEDMTAAALGSYRATRWAEAPPDDLLPLVHTALQNTFSLPENMYTSRLYDVFTPHIRKPHEIRAVEQLFDHYKLWHHATMCHSPFWPMAEGSIVPIRPFLEFLQEQDAVLVGPHYWSQFPELLPLRDFIPLPHTGLNHQWREVTDTVDRFLRRQRHSRVVVMAASSVVVPIAHYLHDAYSVPHTFWPIGQFLCSYLKSAGSRFEGPYGVNYAAVFGPGLDDLRNRPLQR